MKIAKGSFFTPVLENVRKKLKLLVEDDQSFYGGNNTWHDTGTIDVQLNENGDVVAVWFRCMTLPFTQSRFVHSADQGPLQGEGSIKGILFEEDK